MLKVEQLEQLCKVTINGEMTIYTAAELHDLLLPILNEEKELEINLENVGEIDSSGVQLLMLARKERGLHGKTVSMTNHSEAVVDVFDLMGLVNAFNDPILLPREQGK